MIARSTMRRVSLLVISKVAVLSTLLALVFQPVASAYPGLADNTGYFYASPGVPFAQHDSVLPWTAGCSFAGLGGTTWDNTIAGNYSSPFMAMPLNQSGGSSGNKTQFRDFLVNQYNLNRCNNWSRMGVAFIVHTMLGHSPNRVALLGQNDWDEFNARIINNPTITMSYTQSANPVQNSYGHGFVSGVGGSQDMFFYSQAGASGEPMYSFSGGGYSYSIKLRCANPAGSIVIPPVATPPIGRIDGISCSTATGWTYDADRPSASINVQLWIDGVNRGTYPANTARPDVNAQYGVTGNHGFSIDISSWVNNGVDHSVRLVALGINAAGTADGSDYVLGTATVGASCRDYQLNPLVILNGPTVVASGATVTFNYEVFKSGTTAAPSSTPSVKQYIVPPNVIFNDGIGSEDDVNGNCDPRYATGLCATSWDLPARVFNAGNNPVVPPAASPAAAPVNTSGMTPGTRVCRMLAVAPAGQSGGGPVVTNRWSAPVCIAIGKKPYLSIINGDIWAGGSFRNSANACPISSSRGIEGSRSSFQDGRIYGAFAEYAALSLRGIQTFGSGGKPVGTGLTFQNSASPYGNFSPATDWCLRNALDYYSTMPITPTTATTIQLANIDGVVSTPAGANVTIQGGTIPAGKRVVLIVDGSVTITGNITYAATSYADISQLPSVVVISRTGSILVQQAVTQIDGYYQAFLDFVTCEEGQTSPNGISENDNRCQAQLTVNGAVTASRLIARRIYGGGAGATDLRNQPAERFVFRPDVFLSLYAQSQSSGQLRTISEKELPPRY